MQYDLPPWSISILPDCKNVVYNTARSFIEATPFSSDTDKITKNGLWEQIAVTRDASDYLWYMTEINIAPGVGFLRNGQSPLLTVMSAAISWIVEAISPFSAEVEVLASVLQWCATNHFHSLQVEIDSMQLF